MKTSFQSSPVRADTSLSRCISSADWAVSRQYFATIQSVSESIRLNKKHHGQFYTHPAICEQMLDELKAVSSFAKPEYVLADPFAGDGRLVSGFLHRFAKQLKGKSITIYICDTDSEALVTAQSTIENCAREESLNCHIITVSGDAFLELAPLENQVDCCITNPPWLIIKPFKQIVFSSEEQKVQYLAALESYDSLIKRIYPMSHPSKVFGKWGTNLARAGVELSLRLVKKGGSFAIVSPSTFVSDQVSPALRTMLFSKYSVRDVDYYVPEAKLFGSADVGAITIVGARKRRTQRLTLRRFDRSLTCRTSSLSGEVFDFVVNNGYILPLDVEPRAIPILSQISAFPMLKDHPSFPGLTMGREVDETRIEERLSGAGTNPFLKGMMVSRFASNLTLNKFLDAKNTKIPSSVASHRITWRDVSRTSQERRIIATIIPPGVVTGNSLGVAYFAHENAPLLRALLGIISSLIFEFQVRSVLTTNHVPSGILKSGRVPVLTDNQMNTLSSIVEQRLSHQDSLAGEVPMALECQLECMIAQLYGLSQTQFQTILECFQLNPIFKHQILETFSSMNSISPRPGSKIPNHYAAKLSELDMLMLSHVPQGGNWKNIPESVPSHRLVQIRQSFKEGKGSRSTYYGRLRPDRPAYTINTYFSRPGNGCNAHYDQQRTISQREAARFQSFPDSFVFLGSKGAIDNQIGNAVPPLLAYQIATALNVKGMFVDLFCGAGGLGLGFCWAGWKPIIANDIDEYAIQTHAANIHEEAFAGDITEDATIKRIVSAVKKARKQFPKIPLFILGGPPCQGFSTANCVRSSEDQRNWLFRSYIHVVELVKPDGFVFENVRGILNLEAGRFFQMIKSELTKTVESLDVHEVNSAHFAVPQRRERVIIIGGKTKLVNGFNLVPITSAPPKRDEPIQDTLFPSLPTTPTAAEAISDLPAITHGEDGSMLDYATPPTSLYQKLMRGLINPQTYLSSLHA